jgi:hypothetical protein
MRRSGRREVKQFRSTLTEMFTEKFGYDVYYRRRRAPNFFINAFRIEHGALPTVKRSCNNGSHPR